MLKLFGTSEIKTFVEDHLNRRSDLDGRVVVDIPAGTGAMSQVLRALGARVQAYDLFPEFFQAEGITCQKADLQGRLPIGDHEADLVLFQEGIEHLPNQLHALRELNRILRPEGTLLLTTPNISNLRSRASHFFMESEVYKRMPPNEIDALWFSGDDRMYFGHLFLLGIQRLRVLAVVAGFRIEKIHAVRASTSSMLLGLFYPLIALVNFWALRVNLKKNRDLPQDEKRRVYGDIVRLNLHPTILFGRHLFIEFRKTHEWSDTDLKIQPDRTERGIVVQTRADPGR